MEKSNCEDCEYEFEKRNSYMHMYIGDVKVIVIACPKHREEAYEFLKQYNTGILID